MTVVLTFFFISPNVYRSDATRLGQADQRFCSFELRRIRFVSISLDLWMTCGCQDIFSVIAYWIDGSLKRRSRYLRMIKMESTSGFQMALHLIDVLDEFKTKENIVAYVTDGGTNLNTCSRELEGIVCCAALDMHCVYKSDCCARIMSSLCGRALSEELCSSFIIVNL